MAGDRERAVAQFRAQAGHTTSRREQHYPRMQAVRLAGATH
ncbi:hypothetical protein [Micromonospora sp. DPT]